MPDGWQLIGPEDAHRDWDVEAPIVAMWTGPEERDVTLYEDGIIESTGNFPIELLGHVLVEWHRWLRGKVS